MSLNIFHGQDVCRAELGPELRHAYGHWGLLQRRMLGQTLSHCLRHSLLSWVVDLSQELRVECGEPAIEVPASRYPSRQSQHFDDGIEVLVEKRDEVGILPLYNNLLTS